MKKTATGKIVARTRTKIIKWKTQALAQNHKPQAQKRAHQPPSTNPPSWIEPSSTSSQNPLRDSTAISMRRAARTLNVRSNIIFARMNTTTTPKITASMADRRVVLVSPIKGQRGGWHKDGLRRGEAIWSLHNVEQGLEVDRKTVGTRKGKDLWVGDVGRNLRKAMRRTMQRSQGRIIGGEEGFRQKDLLGIGAEGMMVIETTRCYVILRFTSSHLFSQKLPPSCPNRNERRCLLFSALDRREARIMDVG